MAISLLWCALTPWWQNRVHLGHQTDVWDWDNVSLRVGEEVRMYSRRPGEKPDDIGGSAPGPLGWQLAWCRWWHCNEQDNRTQEGQCPYNIAWNVTLNCWKVNLVRVSLSLPNVMVSALPSLTPLNRHQSIVWSDILAGTTSGQRRVLLQQC